MTAQEMKFFDVKGLDTDRMGTWLTLAMEKQKDDPVFSFIAAWIAFNYFYASFSDDNHYIEFEKWRGANNIKAASDRTQQRFLIEHPNFNGFFKMFEQNSIFDETIELPIEDMLNRGRKVPSGKHRGKSQWRDLSDDEIIAILYQIRNNLFHGFKDRIKNARDVEVTTAACNFMIPFLSGLLKATYQYQFPPIPTRHN